MRMSRQPSFAPDGMSGASAGESERFAGIRRDYTPEDVAKMAGSELQQAEVDGDVGVSYFDAVATAAAGGMSSPNAMAHSTVTAQFHDDAPVAPAPVRAHAPAQISKVVNHDHGLVHGHAWASHPSNWD